MKDKYLARIIPGVFSFLDFFDDGICMKYKIVKQYMSLLYFTRRKNTILKSSPRGLFFFHLMSQAHAALWHSC